MSESAQQDRPSWGLASILGLIVTLASAAGAAVAAIKGNDTATIGALALGGLSHVSTLGGRYAQAVQLLKRAAPMGQAVLGAVERVEIPPQPITVHVTNSGGGTGELNTSAAAAGTSFHLGGSGTAADAVPTPELAEDEGRVDSADQFADDQPDDPDHVPEDQGDANAARKGTEVTPA
jgi:hypothetical protein